MKQPGIKKVLFISYDGLTDPLGQSQVIPYLAGLTEKGYAFTILSCDKPAKYAANKEYVEQLLAPYPIKWVSIPYHKNPPVLSSLYDYYKMRSTALKQHKQEGFDIVHTRPGLPQLAALYLKKKAPGIKFMNDIRGFWADERVDGGMWNLKNPLYKIIYNFFRAKEDKCAAIAEYNTCLTYRGKEEILKWKNVPQPVKLEVVPCSVDLELFNPENIDTGKKEQFRKELNINEGDFIVSYLGSIGGWYLTNEMMQFCSTLLKRKPEARFLFISNNNHQDIIDAANKYNIPADKIIVKFGRRDDVPVLLSFSNYSLFFIKPCYSKLSSSPTKHGEIMALGIPVIANSGVGDVKEIVEKYEGGFVLDGFTQQEMDAVVDKMLQPGLTFNSQKIREGAKDFYDLYKTVNTYAMVYDKITEPV